MNGGYHRDYLRSMGVVDLGFSLSDSRLGAPSNLDLGLNFA